MDVWRESDGRGIPGSDSSPAVAHFRHKKGRDVQMEDHGAR